MRLSEAAFTEHVGGHGFSIVNPMDTVDFDELIEDGHELEVLV